MNNHIQGVERQQQGAAVRYGRTPEGFYPAAGKKEKEMQGDQLSLSRCITTEERRNVSNVTLKSKLQLPWVFVFSSRKTTQRYPCCKRSSRWLKQMLKLDQMMSLVFLNDQDVILQVFLVFGSVTILWVMMYPKVFLWFVCSGCVHASWKPSAPLNYHNGCNK